MTNIKDLKELQRHQKGVCQIGDFTVEYIDSLSTFYDHMDIFEKEVYKFTSKTSSPKIIDAGGYIGVQTLYFKQLYPDSEITVFEPDPKIFEILKKNIETNKLEKVKLINAGLGKENRKINLYPDGADAGSMIEKHNGNSIEVDIVKLSDYLNEPIDFLKMNIEGMEADVIEEIALKLHNVDQFIFEYHCFHNFPQSLGNLLNILDKAGFRYVVTDATSAKVSTPFALPDDYKYFNLIYAKNWNKR